MICNMCKSVLLFVAIFSVLFAIGLINTLVSDRHSY